jgi:hypothetical protein
VRTLRGERNSMGWLGIKGHSFLLAERKRRGTRPSDVLW